MSKSSKGPFVVIITDKGIKTFSVEGPVSDDTRLGNAVCDAQKQGRRVNCHVPTGITSVVVAAAQYQRAYPDMTRVERGSIVLTVRHEPALCWFGAIAGRRQAKVHILLDRRFGRVWDSGAINLVPASAMAMPKIEHPPST